MMMFARVFAGVAVAATFAGCAARTPTARVANVAAAEASFNSYCAACHQYDGQGMGDAPPLDDSPWVTGPPERLIKIVLHGVRGRMEVAGRTYDREMPGFGQTLSDAETAALLTFVRRRFAGMSEPITPAAVSRIRASNQNRTAYWSVEELLAAP